MVRYERSTHDTTLFVSTEKLPLCIKRIQIMLIPQDKSGLTRLLHKGGRKMMVFIVITIFYSTINGVDSVTHCPCGFMNNILSASKYCVSPEGVSLMNETNNLASHLERSPLIQNYSYESTGDRPTCFANLPINSKSFMQYAG